MSKLLLDKSIRLIVCDMAGTTVNEGGIVYKTLYKTIKDYGIQIEENDISKWYGANKTEVLNHFLVHDPKFKNQSLQILPELLENFKINLKKSYFEENCLSLIDPELPTLFNTIRNSGIKIALNTGYSRDIQSGIIDKLNMDNFVDGYISSEDVLDGRPQTYMINTLMKRFNIQNSKEVVKIGDSVNDIKEGKNARCKYSVGVLSGAETKENLVNIGADFVINSVMDLELDF
jgi:phosphonatase-like hydrolase